MDNRELFEPYIEDEYDYRFYLSARYEKTLVEGEHNVSEVKVAGLEHVNPEHVLATIDIDTDKPVSNEQAAEAAVTFRACRFVLNPARTARKCWCLSPKKRQWATPV